MVVEVVEGPFLPIVSPLKSAPKFTSILYITAAFLIVGVFNSNICFWYGCWFFVFGWGYCFCTNLIKM